MTAKKDVPLFIMSKLTDKNKFEKIQKKRKQKNTEILAQVEKILGDIEQRGDKALFAYAKRFDGLRVTAKTIRLKESELKKSAALVPSDFKIAVKKAAARIRTYHKKQHLDGFSITTGEGTLQQIVKPLKRVGLYIPGGFTVYPSSVLMNAIPAQIAGVKELVVVTPVKEKLDPKLAFVIDYLKISEVYSVGGAHAIAALAHGTKSIPRVDKVVGPGGSYVALAKKAAYGTVDIDMVAGPSEVAVLCDESADAQHVALDLLSQAEHGSGDESAVCVTDDALFAKKVQQSVVEEINNSPVRAVLEKLAAGAISICACADRKAAHALVNDIAPEHLQIITRKPKADLKAIDNAGAVFLGPWTPVALGDYYIGTNHVLPTGGAARFASPLGVTDFLKRISVTEVSREGLIKAAKYVSTLARSEKFIHHALSVEKRIENK